MIMIYKATKEKMKKEKRKEEGGGEDSGGKNVETKLRIPSLGDNLAQESIQTQRNPSSPLKKETQKNGRLAHCSQALLRRRERWFLSYDDLCCAVTATYGSSMNRKMGNKTSEFRCQCV